MRSVRVRVGCSEESLRAHPQQVVLENACPWARSPEDFRVSYALRQHPVKLVKLLGITWLGGSLQCTRRVVPRGSVLPKGLELLTVTLRWPGGTKGSAEAATLPFPT